MNQLDIAEYAVLQAQKDRNFENWMNCTDVWENFLHEAFKKGLKTKILIPFLTPRLSGGTHDFSLLSWNSFNTHFWNSNSRKKNPWHQKNFTFEGRKISNPESLGVKVNLSIFCWFFLQIQNFYPIPAKRHGFHETAASESAEKFYRRNFCNFSELYFLSNSMGSSRGRHSQLGFLSHLKAHWTISILSQKSSLPFFQKKKNKAKKVD